VTVKLQMTRWRCLNDESERQTFSEQLSGVAARYARRTLRIGHLVQLFGHVAGGRPGERLMKRLGMPASDDTILRHLKRSVTGRVRENVSVLGIDDWSWRKGASYGTVMVDMERHEVVDVLADRSAATTADWLLQRPHVEIVSRDRCGLYAQGAREGAPQARQVADRFHLFQNLRETIENQLSRSDRGMTRPSLPITDGEDSSPTSCSTGGRQKVAEHRHLTRRAHDRSRQAMYERVQILKAAGRNVRGIAREMGVNWRTAKKWVHATAFPSAVRGRRRRLLRDFFGTICRAAGRAAALAAGNCSRKSSHAVTRAVIRIWIAF